MFFASIVFEYLLFYHYVPLYPALREIILYDMAELYPFCQSQTQLSFFSIETNLIFLCNYVRCMVNHNEYKNIYTIKKILHKKIPIEKINDLLGA